MIDVLSPGHPVIYCRPVVARQCVDPPNRPISPQDERHANETTMTEYNDPPDMAGTMTDYSNDDIIQVDESSPYDVTSFVAEDIQDDPKADDDPAVNDYDDGEPIFEGSSITIDVAMTAILKFVVVANLSNSNLSVLLSTIQLLFSDMNNCLPKTLYKFNKYFKDVNVMRKVYYCREHRTLSSGACRYCGLKKEFVCWNGIVEALKKRMKTKEFYNNVSICII